jgi:hypothetical protein
MTVYGTAGQEVRQGRGRGGKGAGRGVGRRRGGEGTAGDNRAGQGMAA